MASLPFERHRSWIETLGVLLTLCVALALMLTLIGTVWNFFTDPLPEAWHEFVWYGQQNFVAVAAVLLALAPLPRWLPERRSLRWTGLALGIVAAGALGWFAEDGLTLLGTGEHIPNDVDRPHTMHAIFVLAAFVGALGEYRL